MQYQPYPNCVFRKNDVYDLDENRIAILSKLTTRHLLKLLRESRYTGAEYDGIRFDGIEIKAVLDTREHIPNKLEARKLRQEKAKVRV